MTGSLWDVFPAEGAISGKARNVQSMVSVLRAIAGAQL
jgi:hypothetical protein